MVYSHKQAIINADKRELRRCKRLALISKDYKIKYPNEARDASSEKPTYIEMQKRIKLNRIKTDLHWKERNPNRFLEKMRVAQANG